MSDAILGSGFEVEYLDGATWKTAPEPVEIGNLGNVATFIDVTNLASPNATREYGLGLKDTEEKTLSFRYIEDSQDQKDLRALADAGDTVSFRITTPRAKNSAVAGQITFDMVLGSQQLEAPTPDAPLNLLILGRVTGDVSFAEVAV